MTARRKLTDEHHEQIRQLAAEGLGPWTIAKQLGLNDSTVNWFMYSDGLRAPRQTDEKKSYVRNGVTVHRFTRDEDVFIEALRVQDYTLPQIAQLCTKRFQTARKPHSIHIRLIMLAARGEQ